MTRLVMGVMLTAAVAAAAGCGGGPTEPAAENLQRQGTAKLDAMKQLAQAVAANDAAAIGTAVEVLTAANIDAKANPGEAKQIVELYSAKVKGKLKGDQAAQVQAVVQSLEAELK